ncbi:MAG: transcriptional regulator, LuxR family [Acidobacteriaceae bacterium]|nr:transcriptional regulator, LuxR family [Acidobacteriaceae bacterium]
MNRLILADNQAIFRAGAARVLALEEEIRIVAQCDDLVRLAAAIDANRGAVVFVASTLRPDLPALIAQAHASESRVILIAENAEVVPEEIAVLVDCIVSRSITGPELVECTRSVARGQRCKQRANVTTMQAADTVGSRVRDRLTPKEMQIVSLIVQGCKNKDIASQLSTKEQVIKNYLRSIYDKTGVSDRLELALFTIHHRALADAAARVGSLLQKKTA